MIWFTGDHHLSHANIIKYCDRPFEDIKEMNEELIRRYNEVVSSEDTVYFLGDVSFQPPERISHLIQSMHGTKHLILGNHDHKRWRGWRGWQTVDKLKDIRIGEDSIVLCHYPMAQWNKKHHGSIHLHGHSHGKYQGEGLICDVGVDCWDYYPVNLQEIKERLEIAP